MYVIEVSPLLRGGHLEHLTYYSPTAYPAGTLVTIPLRKKEVKGLVLSHKPVSAAKTAVRAATFSLKRLPHQEDAKPLSPLIVETARSLSEKIPATFGAILFALLPPEIQNGEETFPGASTVSDKLLDSPVSVLTAPKEDRYQIYKRRIREAFAHRGSVVFVSPTSEGVTQAAEQLLSGIMERSVILSSDLPKRARSKAYKGLNDLSISKLIITTPGRAFIDRPDITDIIIDDAGSGHYKARTRPYLDLKEALIEQARLSGRQVLLGDLVHKSEDEHLRRLEIYQTEDEEPHRINLESQLRIIESKDRPTSDAPFRLLSEQLLSAITHTLKEKKNVFLYSARRGLSPIVVCGDCGHVFRCPDSGTPYSLFRTVKDGEEKRWFLSSTSGRRERAADKCPECSSWRLKERGIGIQHIEDEIKKHFPENKVFIFDHSTASTAAKAHTIIGDFYAKKGAILLGTAMALPYLEKPVSLSAVVSLDSVRSIPTWRVDEECFSLLMRLREKTIDMLFVQTRTEPDELLLAARSGQLDQFFTEELKLREALHYPPFYKLVHLTLAGPVEAVRNLESEVATRLEKFNFAFYSSPESTENKTVRYGLCRIPSANWPNKELINALRELPPMVRIEVDPIKLV